MVMVLDFRRRWRRSAFIYPYHRWVIICFHFYTLQGIYEYPPAIWSVQDVTNKLPDHCDHIAGSPRQGEEVLKAMNHAVCPYAGHGNIHTVKLPGKSLCLISEGIILGSNDDCFREPGKV